MLGVEKLKDIDNEKMEDMLNLLEKLVNMDSGSYFKQGIDEIGAVLSKEYESIGFDVHVHPHEERGNNLVIRHPDAIDPKVMIVAHMDTVFQRGTAEKRPFKIEGNYAYGPGVVDMKASLVSVLFAMKSLVERQDDAYKNVEIVLNSDEEIGSRHSRSLIEQIGKDKEYALIMEAAGKDGSIVTQRKGGARYKIKVEGVPAHSGSEHEKGRSAIEEIAYKTIKLHKITDYKKGITVNVGLLKGGTSANTIAPIAEAEVDVRITKLEQIKEVEQKMKEICSEPNIKGTKIKLAGQLNRPPMVKTKKSIELIGLVQDIGNEMGIEIKESFRGGCSDGSFTSSMGIATVDGLGPKGGNGHRDDEYLDISSLPERTALLAETISRLTHMHRTTQFKEKQK
ncbi:M20 family metallopeptidase [Bacillus sp. FJAT-49825]|uniref:M20 family metallopeptidase n=1 Tax=Neobacillus rhizophilus TaxID=2833579 RepID=A0A942YVA8_9BACI|nr:M20 family metallopeptidase [Neobacillus rhizophilus]